jgi:hypothetical protein
MAGTNNSALFVAARTSKLSGATSLIPAAQSHTIAFWFKVDSIIANATIFDKGKSGDDYTVNMDGSGNIQVFYAAGASVTLGTVVTGAWHHIALANTSGTSLQPYFDGAAVGGAVVTTGPTNASSFVFGDDPAFTPRYFSGRVAEAAVWSGTVLSSGQVAAVEALAAAGQTLSSAAVAPTHYWNMFVLASGAYADQIGAIPLTATNVVTVTDSPIAVTNAVGTGYLFINGIPLTPRLDTGMSRADQEIGNDGQRVIDGTLQRDTRGFKTNFSSTTTPQSQIDAQAWRQLIRGDGDHWSFTAPSLVSGIMLSDKDANVITITGTASYNTSLGKYGSGFIALPASTDTAAFAGYNLAAGWIMGCWHFDSGAYHSYLMFGSQAGGAVTYKDGVLSGNPPWAQPTYGPNVLTFTGTVGNAFAAISDVFLYPFLPASVSVWAAGMWTWQQTQLWPTSPYLQSSGDFGSFTCQGKAEASKLLQIALAGAWNVNAEWLDFVLQQE